MSENRASELIDRIQQYLKNQREMYGDFTPQTETRAAVQHDASSSPSDSNTNAQAPTRTDKSTVAEPSEETDAPTSNQLQNKETSMSADQPDPPPSQEKQAGIFKENPEEAVSAYDKLETCNTLDELKALCEEANELRTDLDGTNLVFGVGNPDADLMLIGEAPGQREDELGEPFVGRAGKLLDKILAAIHFDRQDVYIGNILKHRPPQNRNPLPEERKRSLPFLKRQIEIINPKLILCLGKVSANTLLDNNRSMKDMRGNVYYFHNNIELMVTYHPAALLRNPNWKRGTWEDVQKLRKRYDEMGCTP